MSDSVQPHRWQPTRLPHPWNSPGKNTGVGCYFLLQRMKVKSASEVAQLCPTLCDPVDCSLPGFSVHGIPQARILERVTESLPMPGGPRYVRMFPSWTFSHLMSSLPRHRWLKATSSWQLLTQMRKAANMMWVRKYIHFIKSLKAKYFIYYTAQDLLP